MGSLFSSTAGGKKMDSVQGPPISFTMVEQRVEVEVSDTPRFDYDDPAMVQFLDDNGYVVIKCVAAQEEVEQALDLLWEFLESDKVGMLRNKPETWTNENFQKVGIRSNGILALNGIQQSRFLWYVRMLPKVRGAFAKIYGTDDLITSFDGGNVFRPWHAKHADDRSKTECGWWHVDQGITLRGRHAIQGLVTMYDATAETGGFCVIAGSHKYHDELLDIISERSKSKKNFVFIPVSFHALNERQIIPLCKAGDLILWDSRTIHCNTPSLVTPDPSSQPTDRLMRATAYVCMNPTSDATPEVLAKRKLIFEYGEGTNHWPQFIPYEPDESDGREKVADIQKVPEIQKNLIIGKEARMLREEGELFDNN